MTLSIQFDQTSIVFGDKPELAFPLMDQGLSRDDIRQQTGQIMGVHDCSLDVNDGEILVLMGLSGSGKSTLLRAVNGLNPVARGTVRVWDGQKLAAVNLHDKPALMALRRHQVAMVFQQFALLPWRTVRENVGFGLELAGIALPERQKRIDAQLELVGLSEWESFKVSELSGGMQQRVGLARAFATEAPILLMDEPFSALDPLIRTKLQDELLDVQHRLRRTILFVSHDLEEAFKLGQRIAIMEGGRIIQTGTPKEIFFAPATDYVRDFVSHINPASVLVASDLMDESSSSKNGPVVLPTASATDIIRYFADGAETIQVKDKQKTSGVITRQSLLRALGRASDS